MPVHVLAFATALFIPSPLSILANDPSAENKAIGRPVELGYALLCAASDHHVLWLIEENVEAPEIDLDRIVDARDRLSGTGRLCKSSRIGEALESCGSIPLAKPASWRFR